MNKTKEEKKHNEKDTGIDSTGLERDYTHDGKWTKNKDNKQ